MIRIEAKIEGASPLLCNAFGIDQALDAENGNSGVGDPDRGSPRERAEKCLYIGSNGKPMVPATNLHRSFIAAGTFFKAGKSKVTTLKKSLLPACLWIDQIELPIISDQDWCVDTRPVRIPATGGRVLKHRPMFDPWALEFSMELDNDILRLDTVRDIVDAAGKRVGLGDFRPDTKGPFGRFRLVKWESEKIG